MKCAWATLVMVGDAYVPGALVVGYSLRKVKTKHDIICMVTDDVSEDARVALGEVFDQVIQVDYIGAPSAHAMGKGQEKGYRPWIGKAYTKWNILSFTQWDKIAFVDADMVFVKNSDHLFDLDTPAGCFVNACEFFITGFLTHQPTNDCRIIDEWTTIRMICGKENLLRVLNS